MYLVEFVNNQSYAAQPREFCGIFDGLDEVMKHLPSWAKEQEPMSFGADGLTFQVTHIGKNSPYGRLLTAKSKET